MGMKFPASFSTVLPTSWNSLVLRMWKLLPSRFVSTNDFATRVNKVCRGHASCSKVPMDKDLFVDLEAFAKAFRKEVPPDVLITVTNLFGTAMKVEAKADSSFSAPAAFRTLDLTTILNRFSCQSRSVPFKVIQPKP